MALQLIPKCSMVIETWFLKIEAFEALPGVLEGVGRDGIGRPTVGAAQAASGAVPAPRARITAH